MNAYNIGLVAEEYSDRIEKRRVNCKVKLTALVIVAIVCEFILTSMASEDYLRAALFKNGIVEFSALIGILIVVIAAIVVAVMFIVFYLISLNRIYKWCTQYSVVFTVLLAVTLGALAPFFLFAVRNKVSVLITEKV